MILLLLVLLIASVGPMCSPGVALASVLLPCGVADRWRPRSSLHGGVEPLADADARAGVDARVPRGVERSRPRGRLSELSRSC